MKQANKLIYSIVAVIVAVILLAQSVFIVQEGEYRAVIKFGEATRVYQEPGLKLKIPFIESTRSLPKYQMIFDSQSNEVLTLDKKPILVDNYTVWRIADVHQFLRVLQTMNNAEDRLGAAVYSTVRRKLSATNYGDIISADTARGNLNEIITEEVREAMTTIGNTGIEIVDVRIKRTDLPEQNKASVYNRMISDRQSIAALYLSEGEERSRIIRAQADRTANVLVAEADAKAKAIIAEGEQEAARIYNEAYSKDPEFYKLYRTLDSYLTSFNGEPVIMMPIDSPYAQILLGKSNMVND